jgi:O-antigen ligase
MIAAVNGVVGLIQVNITPEELSSWGPGYEEAINGEGSVSARTFADDKGNERNRPFGLGGDVGFGGSVGMLAIPAALGLLALSKRRGVRILTGMLAVGTVLAVATSEARTAVLGSVIAVFAFAGLTITSKGGLRTLLALGAALVIGYGAIALLSSSTESGSFDRYESISNPSKALSTAFNYRKDTLSKVPDYIVDIPFGAGIGSKGPAASVAGIGKGAELDGESEPTFLLIELGLPGFLIMLGLTLTLFYISITKIRVIADRETRILLTAIAAPLFAIFSTWFVGVTTATTPTSPYLWFAAGVLSCWLLGEGQRSFSAVTAIGSRKALAEV